MSRSARIVVPDMPHHVTQRGNRRQPVFFCDADYELYKDLMADACDQWGVEIWAYCLMTNHVHLIAVPRTAEALARAIGAAHRLYTKEINRREGWTGFLWQGRFASFVMDEVYTLQAARYVEMNPVTARMVKRAADYRWSSAAAHLSGEDDGLVKVAPLLAIVDDWKSYLEEDSVAFAEAIDYHSSSGWPLGDEVFLDKLAAAVGRSTRPAPRGRPKVKREEN